MTKIAPSRARYYAYIDALRGYAVLLVITSHYASLFPALPHLIRRVAEMGYYGVQLFFITSCLTLLMSWHQEQDRSGRVDVSAFFLRRFFRVAPAYYAAGLLYFLALPPVHGFDLLQALASMAFVNAWHPLLMPTVAGRWSVVPGGWSIGVEWSFYLLFPFFVRAIRTLTGVVALLVITVLLAIMANRGVVLAFGGMYSDAALRGFLYFWFPNQACVFVCGALVYLLILRLDAGARWMAHPKTAASLTLCGFFALTFVPLGLILGGWPPDPRTLVICLPLSMFVLALSRMRSGVFVHAWVVNIGKISFSGYLLHFLILRAMEAALPQAWLHASGFRAAAVFLLLWPMAVALSLAAAWCFYRAVEQPGILCGKALIRHLRSSPAIA
ncbi:MAG: acyltransferase [Rhodospirillales bacterium]|nr:acyltransferase [Rhodospirillales bacterium]